MKTLWMICCLLPLAAQGQLVITEVMSNSGHTDTTRNGDWWELTNTGTAAVGLLNYSWDDDLPVVGAYTFATGVTVQPGESIIILDEVDAASFKSAWGLAGTNPVTGQPYQVLARSSFIPTTLPGLSSTGADGVYLFNTTGVSVAAAAYTTASASGHSRVWFTNGTAVPGEFSVSGYLGAGSSSDVTPDVASPGHASAQPVNTPPYFTGTDQAFAAVGQALSTLAFRVQAVDADFGQSVSYTLTSGPDWLSLAPDGAGNAMLMGTPLAAAAGVHSFTVKASDNSLPIPAATERTYLLYIPPVASPVLVNEYTAVNSGKFLNGGTVDSDNDLGTAADLHFGRVVENGGDWFELAVVGAGGPGAVDLRGWRIELSQTFAGVTTTSATIVLSQAPYWAAVPTGTILTFIERNTAQGGLNTGIEVRNNRASLGDSWSNIWLGDPTYLTYTNAATNGYTITNGVVSGISLDEKETRIILKNAAGTIMAGPFGEGVPPGIDVSDTEVFALNADPAPAVSPLAAADGTGAIPGFKDKSKGSSFGLPNEWSLVGQSFIAYARSLTGYETWAAGFAPADPSPGADPDADGRSNWSEYCFGGNPGVADGPASGAALTRSASTVTWQYARRSNDPSLVFTHQRSTNLSDWSAITPTSVTTAPHPTLAGFVIATVVVPASPVDGKEFFRAKLP